jgi:hypothetical protein
MSRVALSRAPRRVYNQGGSKEDVVRRNDLRYESGLVEKVWVGECARCGEQVRAHNAAQAHAWEIAHSRAGCGRTLVPDETGRGWRPQRG